MTHDAPGPQWLGTVVAVLSTVPLAWRRTYPWLAVVGACIANLLPVLVPPHGEAGSLGVTFAWLIAVHAINAYRPAREAALGTGLFLVATTVMVVVTSPASVSSAPNALPNIVFGWAIFGAAAATGQVMARERRRLAAERAAAEARIRDAERRLIARELHDVVAHGVAVMVVQTGAAQQLLARDPVKAAEMLEAVQRTGEQSATELRRMLGLLGGGAPDLGPQPGFADLAGLVDGVRGAGLPVALHIDLPSTPVPPALQLTVYRVVQEALTNAVKHAPGSDTQVRIGQAAGRLDIDIVNERSGRDQQRIDSGQKSKPGHGLVGMRERVSLYGGHLAAGPTVTGWRIKASLPMPSTSPTPAPTGIQP